MHSFVAFIDEAGDEGFTFRPHPTPGSSEWFVLGASIMREKNRAAIMRRANQILAPIEALRQSPFHFMRRPHEERVAIAHMLGTLSARIASVAVNKPALGAPADGHTLQGNRRLYFYYTRYLLERLSWVTRDHRRDGEGDGFCKLVFSRAKNLSYEALKQYLHKLKNEHQTEIDWTAIDPERIEVLQHADSLGLRFADAVASGTRCALELTKHGFCEDRYLRLMRGRIYCRGGNYLSYGFKIVPDVPLPEPAHDNRYSCLGWFTE